MCILSGSRPPTITEHYSGWRQLYVRAQPCMQLQGAGNAACLLCMPSVVNFQHTFHDTVRTAGYLWVGALNARFNEAGCMKMKHFL
jgi:hypothetical protein